MMRHMPAIPESTRSLITFRLLDHAGKNWPQLAKVRARYHGSFACITGVLRDSKQIPLFRLRYGCSAPSSTVTSAATLESCLIVKYSHRLVVAAFQDHVGHCIPALVVYRPS